MALKDLHLLPRVEDGMSFLYVDHSRIEQEGKGICVWEKAGRTNVPCAALSLLMLGPGCTITHAAVRACCDCGCLIVWCGEEGVRVYGVGLGETRSSRNLLRQAAAWADSDKRMTVVRRMYELRFEEAAPPEASLQQLRGREGRQVRTAYETASRLAGLEWKGRDYARKDWKSADPLNRALSCANSCLYGVCHAAIVAAGYSPAIGFIHTGKALSFVYDIADLYKLETSIPAAFGAVTGDEGNLETRVRRRMRDLFLEQRILARVLKDLDVLLQGLSDAEDSGAVDFDADDGAPGGLWDPVGGVVEGGVSYREGSDGCDDPGAGSGEPSRGDDPVDA